MINPIQTIAIIPARGGSKGIPQKNVIDFCGHPLIAWTIACARRCSQIDSVYVSTDDDSIARIAESYGANVIVRPVEISGDAASSESALIHCCETLKVHGIDPNVIVFLQATSPLRETSELDGALTYFRSHPIDSLFSAAEPEDLLMWMQDGEELESLNYNFRDRKPRQAFDSAKRLWVETGSFYLAKTRLLVSSGNRLCGRIGLWPVAFWKSFEIDSTNGLRICQTLMRQYELDLVSPKPSNLTDSHQ